jgi:hypothetical protein
MSTLLMNRRLPPGVVHAVAGVAGLKPLPRPQLICIEPRKSFTGDFGAQFEPFADECRLLLADDFLEQGRDIDILSGRGALQFTEQVSDARELLDHEAVEVAPETGARSLSRSKFWHPNLPGMSSKKACTA